MNVLDEEGNWVTEGTRHQQLSTSLTSPCQQHEDRRIVSVILYNKGDNYAGH